MKKLSLVLLVSCLFVGGVSAMDAGNQEKGTPTNQAVDLLKAGATRLLPAAGGYVAANLARNTGFYGFATFCGLAATPVLLDYTKNPRYTALKSTVRTALNSFAAGVAANVAVGYVPRSVKTRFSSDARLNELSNAGRRY
jgi:hypothetical protein